MDRESPEFEHLLEILRLAEHHARRSAAGPPGHEGLEEFERLEEFEPDVEDEPEPPLASAPTGNVARPVLAGEDLVLGLDPNGGERF